MKNITINPTYKKVRRRTLSLQKINLSLFTDDEIIELLHDSFSFQIDSFLQVSTDKSIYRARVNEDKTKKLIYEPFDNKNQITYLRNSDKYGRCNTIGDSVFYGSDGLEVAVCESCNGFLSQKSPTVYLTIGEWKLKKNIEVSIICHSKRARNKSGDLFIAYQSLLNLKKRTATNRSEIRIWKKVNSFLSNEFSKKVESHENFKYKITAIFTNRLLKSRKVSGVWYPSVGYRFHGHNVAFGIDLIDNGSIVLESVNHVECTFVNNNQPPKIKILGCTHTFSDDRIIW